MSCDPLPSAPPAATPPSPTPFGQLTHYCGFDWAGDSHQVAVVDKAGTLVLEMSFPDTAQGWAELRQKLGAFGAVGVAIETSAGPAVETSRAQSSRGCWRRACRCTR